MVGIVTVAFLGSMGHCIGMCGGFVLAYSSAKIDPAHSKAAQFAAHLTYNLGRISSYMVLGALFGFLGSVLLISKTTHGLLYVLVGILMVLMGASFLGKSNFLTTVELSLAKTPLFRRAFSRLIHSRSLLSFYLLGVLNGFLPCGLVYFFAASAAATASPFWGAVVMLIFGLSTVPALLGLGFIVGFLKRTNFRDAMIKLASIFILLYGGYMLYKGYWFIFDPKASIHTCH